MSLNLSKTICSSALRLLNGSRVLSSSVCRSSGALSAPCRQSVAGTPRGFARSMWCLASRNPHSQVITGVKPHSNTCNCCGLHTQGDQELAEFLSDEIKLEKESEKNPGQSPKFTGFDITSDGAEVSVSRKTNGETLTIKWNVNDTVDDDFAPEFDEAKPEEAESAMVSKPMFTVYLNKGAATSLALQCCFPSDDPMEPADQQDPQALDAMEISEVALVPSLDWDTKIYSVMATVMDGNLYALLLNMLEDRGINSQFMDDLLEFSTTYEHKQYISFLEQLQDFTKK